MTLREELEQIKVKVSINKDTGKFTLAPSTIEAILQAVRGMIQEGGDKEIWEWWKTQKFQKEQGEQEYTMIFEIDLPKILKSYVNEINEKLK